ncbi:MAG: ABC transporter ATP-binding protein [Candidatus Woesearchaeota archaeon]|jgi:putative ABC transport system ATP-binding protein
MKPIIELKNVWKTYFIGDNRVDALSGITLSIHKGEFVAIEGPSGSGKSTCMNIIGCLDLPTQGEVYLDGIDIKSMNESDLAQRRGKRIGFIFQQFNLIPTLTAEKNVTLPMIFQGTTKEQQKKKAEELLNLVKIYDRKDHLPGELSGGQQQRVAIARSLANDPEVIIADEPTGNLDSSTGKIVIEFLKEMNKKGKTIIIVTHDQKIGEQAKRTVYIKDGKIIKEVKRG